MDNYYETLTTLDIEKLIRRNLARRKEKFEHKVKKLSQKIQRNIKLNSYFLKNTSIDIFEKIITNCLTDSQLSGIAFTQENEEIKYRRTKNAIKFDINNSPFILEL